MIEENKKNKEKYVSRPVCDALRSNAGRRGFMMIEAVFSIFIVGIALAAFLSVLNVMYKTEFGKRDYVIASNLAQEGIELVRNIRDNNWKNSDAGFSVFPNGEYCVDYLTHSAGNCNEKLKRNSGGFYEYNNGTTTKFSRKITVSDGPSSDSKTVTSAVTWTPAGAMSNTSIVMTDTLYAWADSE